VVIVVYGISICDVNHAVISGMRRFLRLLMWLSPGYYEDRERVNWKGRMG